MQLELVAPPRPVRRKSHRINRCYAEMITLLVENQGEWILLDPETWPGTPRNSSKARSARPPGGGGMFAQTTIEDNQRYMRLMIPESVAEAEAVAGEGADMAAAKTSPVPPKPRVRIAESHSTLCPQDGINQQRLRGNAIQVHPRAVWGHVMDAAAHHRNLRVTFNALPAGGYQSTAASRERDPGSRETRKGTSHGGTDGHRKKPWKLNRYLPAGGYQSTAASWERDPGSRESRKGKRHGCTGDRYSQIHALSEAAQQHMC